MARINDQYSRYFPEQNPKHFHHNHVANVVQDVVKNGKKIQRGIKLLEAATSKEITKTNKDLMNFVTTFIKIMGDEYGLKKHSARFHELKAKFEAQAKEVQHVEVIIEKAATPAPAPAPAADNNNDEIARLRRELAQRDRAIHALRHRAEEAEATVYRGVTVPRQLRSQH